MENDNGVTAESEDVSPVAGTADLPDSPGMLRAYQNAAATGGFSAQELLLLNRKLLWIQAELRRVQPRIPGSVLLDLRDCGKGCMGCPHQRWLKWFAPAGNNELKLLGSRISGDPALALGRSGRFKESYHESLGLVAEAKRLLQQKARLVDALRRLAAVARELRKQDQVVAR